MSIIQSFSFSSSFSKYFHKIEGEDEKENEDEKFAAEAAAVPRSISQAIPAGDFGDTPLQPKPRLLVTFLMQKVEQIWRGVLGKLAGQFIEARKNREQTGLRICRRHRFHGGIQFDKRLKNGAFGFAHFKSDICPTAAGMGGALRSSP